MFEANNFILLYQYSEISDGAFDFCFPFYCSPILLNLTTTPFFPIYKIQSSLEKTELVSMVDPI